MMNKPLSQTHQYDFLLVEESQKRSNRLYISHPTPAYPDQPDRTHLKQELISFVYAVFGLGMILLLVGLQG